jgi:uncharacterized protein YndB with AHSA1/START domain
MADSIRIQVQIAATPEVVYKALVDAEALKAWFAEYAEVTQTHYNFWGRFTLDAPNEQQGQHAIIGQEPNKRLSYRWHVMEHDTTVTMDLVARDGQTILMVTHTADDKWKEHLDDFWFLSLENLRRYVEGKRCEMRVDFTESKFGDVRASIEIDGSAADVFATLIKPEQLNRWIASNASVEAKEGGKYDFGWGAGPMKIVGLEENKRLSIIWEEHGDTTLTYTLEESGGKTRLTLVHSGFAPDYETDGLKWGWRNFLNWIRSIVEEGIKWQPPIKELSTEQIPFFAEAMARQQHTLINR